MSDITEHPAYREAYAKAAANPLEPISDVIRRWNAERDLLRADPILAKLLRVEAVADHRAENHVCAASKLPMIRDLVREIIEAKTGKPFSNPIFPD